MPKMSSEQVTQIVNELASGHQDAAQQLFPLLYDALRQLAGRYLKHESPAHTFSPTALVHEVYLKLVDQNRVEWPGKTHFLAVGAQAMRRILIDHARGRQRDKRGGGRLRVQLDESLTLSPERDADLLAVDEALEKLGKVDPRQAAIVEMRFFGGLTVAEVAEVLGISKRTVESEWTMIRAWLRRELADKDEGP
jgi:RNA polymerase sigma-70 factor, ECF subfamily